MSDKSKDQAGLYLMLMLLNPIKNPEIFSHCSEIIWKSEDYFAPAYALPSFLAVVPKLFRVSPRAINRLASKIAGEKKRSAKKRKGRSELYNLATTFMQNNEARRRNGGLKSTYYRTVPDHC